MMIKRCAIYARVSTRDQTCENQLRELRAHAQQRRWEIVEEYVDTGFSGSNESRPALDRLMKSAWAGKFQVALVWRFDRFARSTKHLVTALETFRSLGISFTSLQEQIDTATPLGQAMFTIISAMAQLERDVIRDRVRAGLRRAKSQGVRLGRKPLLIDAHAARRELARGKSVRTVAKELGVGASTLSSRLRAEIPPATAGSGAGRLS